MNDADRNSIEYLLNSIEASGYSFLDFALRSHPLEYEPNWVELRKRIAELEAKAAATDPQDICGLCGHPGGDKIPHPIYWPGEQAPNTELVHAECEQTECARAHARLSTAEREAFLSYY